MTEDEFREMRSEMDEAKAAAERARGAQQQLKEQLKEQFGCKDVEAARVLLAKLQRKAERLGRELSKACAAYNKRWKT